MIQTRIHFGIGFSIGLCISALFFYFFSPRYDVIKSNQVIIKQDKRTGDSWAYEGNQWKKIKGNNVNWKSVDNALIEALKGTAIDGENNSVGQIAALKKKYSFLKKVSDEDIMERIKYIYARKIMLDLYFSTANLE